jgi:hypothetical protein
VVRGRGLKGAKLNPREGPIQGLPLPNFMIVGAMKAGTTSLFHYLDAHPDVCMSKPKEPHFFVSELKWSRGWEWYQRHFEGAGPASAVGEASVTYSQHPTYGGVPERIAEYLPDIRLIYVMRDPIARIRSEYVHRVLIGRERQPIDKAVLRNPRYVAHSSYAMQIDRYLSCFSREQLLLVLSDDLRDQRESAVRLVYDFIGVDADVRPPQLDETFYDTDARREYSKGMHMVRRLPGARSAAKLLPHAFKERARQPVSSRKDLNAIQIDKAVRAELIRRLAGDMERLKSLLGEDFRAWGLV